MGSRRATLIAIALAGACTYDRSGVRGAASTDDDAGLPSAIDGGPAEHDALPADDDAPPPADAAASEPDAGPDAGVDAGSEDPPPDAEEPQACEAYDCHDPACEPCGSLQVCCADGSCAALGLCF